MRRVFCFVFCILLLVPFLTVFVCADVGEFDDTGSSYTAPESAAGQGSHLDEQIEFEEEFEPLEVDGVMSVGALTVYSDTVLMSIPEDNNYPPNSPLKGAVYIQASTSQLGTVLIYIPIDYQRNSLTFDQSGNIVNIRSAQITGIMYRGSTAYNFRIASFGIPSYRLFNTTNSYVDLNVTSVFNTNVLFVERNEDIDLVEPLEMYQLIEMFMLGGVLLLLFIKRF